MFMISFYFVWIQIFLNLGASFGASNQLLCTHSCRGEVHNFTPIKVTCPQCRQIRLNTHWASFLSLHRSHPTTKMGETGWKSSRWRRREWSDYWVISPDQHNYPSSSSVTPSLSSGSSETKGTAASETDSSLLCPFSAARLGRQQDRWMKEEEDDCSEEESEQNEVEENLWGLMWTKQK